jgi:hypothetical protein
LPFSFSFQNFTFLLNYKRINIALFFDVLGKYAALEKLYRGGCVFERRCALNFQAFLEMQLCEVYGSGVKYGAELNTYCILYRFF